MQSYSTTHATLTSSGLFRIRTLTTDPDPTLSDVVRVGNDWEQYRLFRVIAVKDNGTRLEVKAADDPESSLDSRSPISLLDKKVKEEGDKDAWKIDEFVTLHFLKKKKGEQKITRSWKRGFEMT